MCIIIMINIMYIIKTFEIIKIIYIFNIVNKYIFNIVNKYIFNIVN